MLVRAADLRPSGSPCHYFDNGPTVGCVMNVCADAGRPLGYLVLEGKADPDDPLGKMRHGVTIIPTVKDLRA